MHLHRSSGPTREAFRKNTALTKRSIGKAFVPIDLRGTVRAASSVVNQSKSLRVFLRPGAAVPHTTTLLLLSRWVVHERSERSERAQLLSPQNEPICAGAEHSQPTPASKMAAPSVRFCSAGAFVWNGFQIVAVARSESHPKDLDYYFFFQVMSNPIDVCSVRP